jgi:hypothetical protein
MNWLPLFFPLLFWIGFRLVLGKGPFEMDFAMHKFSFLMVFPLYKVVYWVIFILSIIGAFIFADLKLPHLGEIFLLGAVCAILFNLWVAVCYESYLAIRYSMTSPQQSNYTGWKYSLTLTLGTSAITLFLIGLSLAFSAVAGF